MNWKWQLAQKLEIRWWQQYLKKKSVEPYLDAKKNYWNRILKDLKIMVPDQSSILDAGCGPAGIFMVLPQGQVTALDPLLQGYQKKLLHFNARDYPWTTFKNQPLETFEKIPVFDYVFCLNAINHVRDINLAMDVLVASTKVGATIVLSIDTHRSPILKYIFKAFPGDLLHPHQHDLLTYQSMLTQRNCNLTQSQRLKKGVIFDYWILVAQKMNG